MGETSFDGFQPEIFKFLSELALNNNKEWFVDNRARYESDYLVPAMEFVNAMHDSAAAFSPPHRAVAKINGSVRRINRDVRFSKDKSPYNARLHLVFWTGDHPNRSPAIHLILDPETIGFGAGQWALDSGQIGRFRQALSTTASRNSFLHALEGAKSVGCEMGQPELKKVPKNFADNVDWSELFKYKSIVCRTHSGIKPPKEMFTPQALPYFSELFTRLVPLNAWINENIS